MKFDLLVDQLATVSAFVEAKYKIGRKGTAKEHHLTNVTTTQLEAGLRQLTLHANSGGRRILAARKHLEATIVVSFNYADGTTLTLSFPLLLAPAADAHKLHKKH